jgi:hypothetical protein
MLLYASSVGNPSVNLSAVAPMPDMSRINGVLARVPGDIIATTNDHFPKACAGEQLQRFAEAEVPGLGTVRIRYVLASRKFRRTRIWTWRAEWADVVNVASI